MNEDELYHYGVLGMKWGRRKAKSKKSSTFTSRRAEKKAQKQRVKEAKQALKQTKKSKKVKIKDLSNEELQSKINRLQMEKRYRDLKRDEVSAGRKLVGDILMASGKSVGIQLTTYVAGKAINKAMKDEVIRVGKNKNQKKAA